MAVGKPWGLKGGDKTIGLYPPEVMMYIPYRGEVELFVTLSINDSLSKFVCEFMCDFFPII